MMNESKLSASTGDSSDDLRPCPFCGEVPEVTKHFREEVWQMVHRCDVMGPLSIDWSSSIDAITEKWNTRAYKGERCAASS